MEVAPGITIDDGALRTFCVTHHIRRLKLFGSALRGELRPGSDVDLLVEFEPGQVPGLLSMAALELELGDMIGREVELRTPHDLSRYFRDQVVAAGRVLYDAA
jgi:predicted nucleotidyltransferase